MTQADFQPVSVFEPTVAALPLVCDSPHSGETYPADFGAAASLAQRQGEDTHVDALWSAARAGATLVAANFRACTSIPIARCATWIPSCWPNPGPAAGAR